MASELLLCKPLHIDTVVHTYCFLELFCVPTGLIFSDMSLKYGIISVVFYSRNSFLLLLLFSCPLFSSDPLYRSKLLFYEFLSILTLYIKIYLSISLFPLHGSSWNSGLCRLYLIMLWFYSFYMLNKIGSHNLFKWPKNLSSVFSPFKKCHPHILTIVFV